MTHATNQPFTRPSRRTVVRAGAWSVPVVAASTAAPAFAASPCDPRFNQTLLWNGSNVTFTHVSDVKATAVYDPDGTGPVPPLTLTVTAAYSGNMKAGSEFPDSVPNGSLDLTNPVGGLGVAGLALRQATTSLNTQGSADRGTYTFTFSVPVTNLQLTITDIDSATGDYWDVVQPSAGYTVVSMASALRTDSGGYQGGVRYFPASNNAPVDTASSSAGNLTINYAGPITSFSIIYYNGQSPFNNNLDQGQAVFVSGMTFNYKPC